MHHEPTDGRTVSQILIGPRFCLLSDEGKEQLSGFGGTEPDKKWSPVSSGGRGEGGRGGQAVSGVSGGAI